MKSIFNIAVLLILFTIKGFAQENINNYKYVVVPTSFSFLNEPDKYQLNSLTKFLFDKIGFTTLMADSEFPDDLNANRCLGLYADVEKHKAFLNTKLQVHLKDCNNRIVVSSEIGESREKQFDKVYSLAIRDAFKSFDNLNYSYQPSSEQKTSSTASVAATTKTQEEIERLKQEVELLREKQQLKAELEKQALIEKEKPQTKPENTSIKEAETVQEAAKLTPAKTVVSNTKSTENSQVLKAVAVENGYTITDGSSKVLYHLVFSGKEDVYIVKGQDAIVYKVNNTWILSTANDSGVSMKTLKVKFD